MILVIDANPFISGFLRDSINRKVLLSDKLTLYSPEWLLAEFERNESDLKSKFTDSKDFAETKGILFTFVNLVPAKEYSEFMKEASKLTHHTKDMPYFALALHLNCPIWYNEKLFKRQSRVKVYSTSELLKELNLQ